MNCKSCGAPLKNDDEFCEYCGALTEYGKALQDVKMRKKINAIEYSAIVEPIAPAPQPEPEPPEDLPEMRAVSMGFVFVMYVITLGLYSPYWYFSRSVPMKKLHSKDKFPVWLGDLYVMMCAAFFLIPFNYKNLGLPEDLLVIIWLIATIGIPIVSWRLGVWGQRILKQHAENYNRENLVAPSGLGVFVFGAAYLQYSINEMIKMKILAPKV